MSLVKSIEKNITFTFAIVLIVAGFGYFAFHNLSKDKADGLEKKSISSEVTNFEQCALKSGIVQESHPRKCIWNGDTFVETITEQKVENKEYGLILDNLKNNDLINSPLSISGKVDSNWFFEASFPVKILDNNRNIIKETTATTKEDWTKDGQISFNVNVEFDPKDFISGFMILRNDNPSGLKENIKSLEVPIKFAKNVWNKYTNSYYPSLEVNYSGLWKFETKLDQKLPHKEGGSEISSRVATLSQGNNILTVNLVPVTGPVGWGGGDVTIDGVKTVSNFYRYTKDGVYYYIDSKTTLAGLLESSPSTKLVETTLKCKEYFIYPDGCEKDSLSAIVRINYKGDEKLLAQVEDILSKSKF